MNNPAKKATVFLKEVKAEMTKVSWPSRQETIKLTLIVVGVSVLMAVFIGSLDFFFTKAMELAVR